MARTTVATPPVQLAALVAARNLTKASRKPVAREDIGASLYVVRGLLAADLIEKVAVRHTGQAGRPAFLFRLTDKGRKRADRAAA